MNFGGSTEGELEKERESGRSTTIGSGRRTEQLKLDEAGVQKIIEDVLGGPQGLASIFAGQNTAGIFDSTVSAQAAGDLAANLVGEIAKITGVKEVLEDDAETTEFKKKRQKDKFNLKTEGSFGF